VSSFSIDIYRYAFVYIKMLQSIYNKLLTLRTRMERTKEGGKVSIVFLSRFFSSVSFVDI
jgi:hypothetical protein